jgi:hypothetical protein
MTDRPARHLHQVDLARRWNLSPRTLERWRGHGIGPCYLKIGGRVVYRLEDIVAFEAAQRRQATGATRAPQPGATSQTRSIAPC